ncbi:Mediator-associated protein 1 [Acorus calamus]|uniref:Mediator-associated protein 1 n=1 Tax=Acorus calamus TaxID=4465 RepID=A0AAV9CXI7_ACOCL|nr:Mediator-associated protein 1 [Acorus calamus]
MAHPLHEGDDRDLNHNNNNNGASFDDIAGEDEDEDFSSTSDDEGEIHHIIKPSQPQSPSSSSDSPPPPSPTPAVPVPSPDRKRRKLSPSPPSPDVPPDAVAAASTAARKPSAMDDRRLFQRLWTDEDEIAILQGFLEFTSQNRKGGTHHNHHYHDTGPFYDQIRGRLQLDFNKNQLVEKLRRLKKKFRNVVARIEAGKDVSFKTPHDQASFEISRKIWSSYMSPAAPLEEADEDEQTTPIEVSEKKGSQRSRKRSCKRPSVSAAATSDAVMAAAEEDEKPQPPNFTPAQPPFAMPISSAAAPNVIEDTVRSCFSPLFKELLFSAIGGGNGGGPFGPALQGGFGGLLGPIPLSFQGGNGIGLSVSGAVDDKWRKQQILELEVYSKRMELVQEHIRSTLDELRSMGGS